jgi:scyllo-inositol 2-dehydrogenase (NADP+)
MSHEESKHRINVGLIGYGFAGSVFHAPLLLSVPDLHLCKIASSRSDQIHREIPGTQVAGSAEEIISDPTIDLVVVATPTASHFEIARAALLAGKHVVVDKPFTATVVEADILIALAESQKRMLSVFQNRRWDNDFLTVQQCIREGPLGTIYTYEAHYDRFRPEIRPGWREESGRGSGILYDLGAHLIDQALVLFGLPQTVTADVFGQRKNAQATDYFHLVLNYGSLRAILHAGTLVCNPGPHFAVHGDSGSFLKYGMDSQEEALKEGKRPGTRDWGVDPHEHYGKLVTSDGTSRNVPTIPGAYQHYYEAIAARLLTAGPDPVNPADSRNGLVVIEAALRSSAERRTIAIL